MSLDPLCRLNPASDRIDGRSAAELLDLPYPGTFNRVRRRLQRVYDPDTGELQPYPCGLTQAQERAFDRNHVLVVLDWGGVSLYGGDWTYSHSACSAALPLALGPGNGSRPRPRHLRVSPPTQP